MPEQPSGQKKYGLTAAAKVLGISPKRLRAYYIVGIFPKPIREPGEDRKGFWYQDRIDWMKYRLDHVHEFRTPKWMRAELDKLLPSSKKKSTGARTRKESDS